MAPRPVLMAVGDIPQFFRCTVVEAQNAVRGLVAYGCMGRDDNYLYSSEEIKDELDSRRGK